jgi:phosphoribosylformylglycinamidine synthase
MKPRVLVLHAVGTNRDREAAWACELAGASAEIITVQALLAAPERLGQAQMLVLPGGFSNGDDLGAGVTWALALKHGLRDALGGFVDAGKPVLGICNGFQALIKAGLLPGGERIDGADGPGFDNTTWPTRRSLCVG